MATVERDPATDLPIILDHEGNYRVLGCLQARPIRLLKAAQDVFPILDESRWKPISLAEWQPPHITNQAGSSCTGHAAECSMEVACAQAGIKLPGPLSGCYVYSWINGGSDQGATIHDAGMALKLHGCCTENECPEGAIFRRQYNTTMADHMALTLRPDLIVGCYRWQDIWGVAAMGFSVLVGITVGNNFSRLDDEGVAPLPDVAVGGHALPVVGLKMTRKYGLCVEVQNSWSKTFGMAGRCLLRKEHFDLPTDAVAILAAAAGPYLPMPAVA